MREEEPFKVTDMGTVDLDWTEFITLTIIVLSCYDKSFIF